MDDKLEILDQILDKVLDDNFDEEIINIALDYRKEASLMARKKLEDKINCYVKVKGFRESIEAPRRLLLREIKNRPRLYAPLLNSILIVWRETKTKLEEEAGDYFNSREVSLSGLFELHDDHNFEDRIKEELDAAENFLVNEQGYNSKDVRLMLWKLLQEAVLFEDTAAEDIEDCMEPEHDDEVNMPEEISVIWEHMLEKLALLPPGDPGWDETDKFVSQVKELAEQKKKEHDLLKLKEKEMQNAIEKITNTFVDILSYFSIENMKEWHAESCPQDTFPETLTSINNMYDLLQEYVGVKSREETTMDSERLKRQQLTQIEDNVRDIYTSLLHVFNQPCELAVRSKDTKSDQYGEDKQNADMHDSPDKDAEEKEDESTTFLEESAAEQMGEEGKVEESLVVKEAENVNGQVEELTDDIELVIDSEPGDQVERSAEMPDQITDETKDNKTQDLQDLTEEGVAEAAQEKSTPETQAQWESAQAIAISLQQEDSEEKWQAFLWAMVIEDDLAGAYWLARTRRFANMTPPVPDWLLKAVQGVRWLVPGTELFINDLLEITRQYQPDSDNNVQELLGLAVALYPVLVSPRSGLLGWLKAPGWCPGLHTLVESVKTFANYGIPLQETDLMGIAGHEQREAVINGAAEGVAQWLEQARKRRTKFKRATKVWQELTGANGELSTIFLLAAEDRRDLVKEIRIHIGEWLERDYFVERITAIDRELNGKRFGPITGDPREQLFRYIQEGCQLTEHWCNLVEKEQEISLHGRNWLSDRINELRNEIQLTLPEVLKTLNDLTTSTQVNSYEAAVHCLKRSLWQLCTLLKVPIDGLGDIGGANSSWEWLSVGVGNLDEAFGRRLLLLPELQLDDNCSLQTDFMAKIPAALCNACADGRTWQQAFSGWIEKKDFRFTECLWECLGSSSNDIDFYSRYQDELAGARASLEDKKQRTLGMIEQAVVDGIIGEERSEYNAVVVGINAKNALDIATNIAILEGQRNKLIEAKRQGMAELRTLWAALQPRLDEYITDEAKKSQIMHFVQLALEKEDTRVVEEILARLTEAVDTDGDIRDEWLHAQEERHILREFIKVQNSIKERLSASDKGLRAVSEASSNSRSWAGLNLTNLPDPQIKEINRTVLAWRRLKQQGASSREVAGAIETIMRYLGFNILPGVKMPVTITQTSDNYLYARVSMSAGGMSPVQQFGSQRQGSYDVVCVWERPSVDTMNAWIRDLRLDNRYVLVLYLGRMPLNRRHGLRQIRNERIQAFTVVDEILLAFLAAERTARLPAFFHCSLPFTNVNPYTPTGYVPPEMFFGRQKMAQELQRSDGSCIVYGGRQLGKSALLRHVQREFHQPDLDQYAVVEDIKLIGDPASGLTTDTIWRKLHDSFTAMGLFSNSPQADQPEGFISSIKKVLAGNQSCRVLVLLDEADNFLDADARENFRIIDQLRVLMQDTQQRFKVVLAGLHNVQRFQGMRNQPLVHYGRPICVGPLEPDAAQKLINNPLGALGYKLKDNSLVLHILSYTNYHPGLIQLFCQELLKRLQSRVHREAPDYPIIIDRNDIEAVYRLKEVQEEIRKRFEWTLVLDRRYQAITLAIIIDQLDQRNGFARAYSSSDILRLGESWWEEDFARIRLDEFRGLLDEMCGLGVLWRNNEGNYRLRSPNLVRLMGTEEEIQDQLLKLEDALPVISEFDPDIWHMPLDCQGSLYSSLTNAQVRNLNPRQSGVGLIFASDALGFSHLKEACRLFVPAQLVSTGQACFDAIPAGISTGSQLEKWLEQYTGEKKRCQQLVLYRSFAGNEPFATELVQAALSFCQRYKRVKNIWLRVIFMFNATAAWEWLTGPEQLCSELENMCDAAVYPHKWVFSAIRQRLTQKDKIDTEEVCQQVLDASGGWPFLLDLLFKCEGDDLRQICRETEGELTDKNSLVAKALGKQLGIEVSGAVLALISFISSEENLPLDFTLSNCREELVGLIANENLTQQNCHAALEYVKRMGLVEISPGEELTVDPLVEKALMLL